MPKSPLPETSTQVIARRRLLKQGALALLLLLLILGFFAWRSPSSPPVPAPLNHTYAEALEQAHNGKPGAARVLYQQLARTDLSDIRRASLLAEIGNYPSPQALKRVGMDLRNDSPLVRQAAVAAVTALVSPGQRSLLLGPLLEDPEPSVRFSATRAMLGLTPDDLGLYFAAFEKSVDDYETALKIEPPSVDNQLLLAQLSMHDNHFTEALDWVRQALALEPENLDAALAQIHLMDKQGQTDKARQLLGRLLERHPQSSRLQHALGMWLLNHGQQEYALLGLAKALELEPENNDYRYDLAVALHDLNQLEAAQKQLMEILERQPGNRRARVLLINYWKENGQLQRVQVLLAELEQQNPDDPVLQQGL
ncbi:tetratricopeptide repeat protein [Pseudomonas sp. DWP3-1-2]|uniref:tetratricopeptide repeat protein n=1 Tax=Pseudomonas sp. DWP3-1-2 TaxID=2804645 RepID=UPI003CF05832